MKNPRFLKSKKNGEVSFTLPYTILPHLRYGQGYSLKEIADLTGIYKQRLTPWLNELCDDKILEKLGRGYYSMTDRGKTIFDQIERYRGKQLVRIENMRVTYDIIKFGNILTHWYWKINKLNNGTKASITTFNDHKVRCITTKDKSKRAKIEVIITKILGENMQDAYHHARNEADHTAEQMEWQSKATLSEGYVTGEPEIAIPCPTASALLTVYGASQIRTDQGIMNRSPGRGADWEVTDIEKAQRIVNMPEELEKIKEVMFQLEQSLQQMNQKQVVLNQAISAQSMSWRII